MKREDFC